METRKLFLIFSLIAVLVAAIPCGSALAGSGEPPEYPTGGNIIPPEAWAVVVVNIGANNFYTVTVRAKRTVDCNVQTDTVFYAPESSCGEICPVSEAEFLNLAFMGVGLFDGAIPNPIITKIKNFVGLPPGATVGTISFDAQLMNYAMN